MGTHVEFASQVLEFMKKFGFDYVILDESHKAKNPNRNTHKVIKQLFVSSTVAYARIATGTLIHNKLTDVVGQAALFNSQIFRTPEEYESENMERVGDTKVMKWRKDTPRRAREQLARHAAVITMKRKEWAFLLPVPIESFIPVSLEMPEEDGGNAHSLMYDVILTNMLELIEQDENIKRLLEGKSTEDEEDSDSEGEDDDDEESGGKEKNGEDDLDDDTLSELEAALGPYLARLDQMLMDPLGDEFGEIYFKGIRQENFVANKVRAVVERIKLSFTDYPWKKGNNYKIKDVCDYKGQRYVLMPPDGVKAMDINYGQTYESIKEPPTDSRWKKEARGKVLVVCRYIRSVNAVYRALPPDLKKLAARFHSDIKERDQNLEDFKSNPISRDRGIQIMIANEHAISEGFNLQICDRVIRAEAPWNPGEIDQTVSRAFRPDPSGKYSRENLYLDWILTNNTLEVAKMGRLISKMLSKAEFDEADNPLYDTINQSELPLIKMDIKRTLQTIRTIDHIRPYIDEYQHLVTIQATEFKHMRDTKPSTMMKIDQTPMMKGAKLLDFVPYVANLEIPDRNNYGLVRLPDAIADTDNTDFADIHQDKKALIGKYVHTDFGNGVIVSVNTSNRVLGMPDSARKVTSVAVQLAGSDEVLSFRPALVYLATNLTEKTIKQFAPKSMWMTDKDRKRLEKQRQEAERAAKRAEKKAKRDLDKETKDLEKLRKVEEARKEKQSGKKPPKEKPQPIEQELEEEENNNLELFPVVYNGYLALEANPEDDSIDMEAYGFKEFGDYAYVVIKDLKTFEAVRKALEKKFKIMPTSSKVLDKLEDAFETGRSKKFSADLAPMAEFPNFYTESHRMSKVDQVTGKPQLRVYPVILKGVLLLNVDLARNPVMRKLLNKAIPGTTVKFQEASGLHIQFFNKKTELAKKVKELKKEGFVVINDEEVTEALEDLAVKSIKAI
jgi:superfamily II DNA/RNA helicase